MFWICSSITLLSISYPELNVSLLTGFIITAPFNIKIDSTVSANLNFIETIKKTTEILQSKFGGGGYKGEYGEYLAKLEQGEVQKSKIKKSAKEFYQGIAIYLGEMIPTIRHIDEELDVLEIDMVSRIIKVKGGRNIHFDDLGTGQGQSAYLMGLLSSSEDRIIIALFDEVAMMDEKSLKPVFGKLKELYLDKKLLFAIVVQKGERAIIRSLL